jgi:hypothetical protein
MPVKPHRFLSLGYLARTPEKPVQYQDGMRGAQVQEALLRIMRERG